ncbi:glycoside hydrolase family 15 [Candidatus Woesearchaeota archaeon]|jgi:GH15 family glucan-1,4-alpha-glucosidase|nr:glycoside hydrolase family 15 [Candidatus Woesearchaeota archaeon]MBT3537328.1 glycoside hydrolase family 15 [Candidatus Woesearchaeota archaeon]MBT4697402.1 glycoside hydrolase family 15 [Candidatus Woesearchaeota archaeon]MBT4716706.1 glycoside hydrolase family 15 [Candidatus Woesearchaeota archaeon]MBT7106362.1 glycoside hydrolase family 15 [Candidatus Woesearchaeota archaeon]
MMKQINYETLVKQHLKILKSLQTEKGLFLASKKAVSTGYDKAWLRDNFYECLAFEVLDDWETVRKTYRALLDIFLKHEKKIDHAISKKPEHRYQYIHARFHPETFNEFWEEWGNKQNDSIGAVLFKIGELEERGCKVIQSHKDIRIIQKLVEYLASVEYWHDPDSGIWEENEEIHASSVGACVAGLKKISLIPQIKVPKDVIERGERMLRKMLPRESDKKFVDMALLTLIYPFDVATPKEREDILRNVEYHLVKERGVIRYRDDYYYNSNPDGKSEEAEWTMGFAFLSIIYSKLGEKSKAQYYLEKLIGDIVNEGLPELYFSHSKKYNDNTPLGWAESVFLVSAYEFNKKHMKGFFSKLIDKIKN